MNENNLYLSFTTFLSLVQEQFTEEIDISPDKIIDNLGKISKSKEYKDISLYHWISGEEIKNETPLDSLSQQIICSSTIILDEGYRDKKERIRQVSRKFLYNIIDDCFENELIISCTQNDRNDVFLFNFLIFLHYIKISGAGLKLGLGEVKRLSFYCEIKDERLVAFNDKRVVAFNGLVERDCVNKLYLSTTFTIFHTKPDVPDNHYKSLYFYNLC